MKNVICFMLLFTGMLFSQEPKKIYIANDDHTDYFWTADDEAYRLAFLEMLDYYLDLTEATRHEIHDHQSRFNCDGNFWMWVYEKNKSPQEFQRLIDQIKSGHISVPYNALVSCLGGTPAEAVIRGMYYAGSMERKHDLDFSLAVAMENQVKPYGLAALWAGSGAQYSWNGICNCVTRTKDAWDREHDIYWWKGPDNSKILMKWNSMLTIPTNPYYWYFIGGYAEAMDIPKAIQFADEDPEFKRRYPYDIIGIFGHGGDALKTTTDAFVTKAKELSNSDRQIIVSNEEDFFKSFESKYGDSIPSLAVSYGNEWDLYCASMAEVSARVKRAMEKLRAAEAMAAIISQVDPNFMNSKKEAAENTWMNLGLYWEHDWVGDGPVARNVRGDWQRKIEGEISQFTNDLFTDAKNQFGKLIPPTSENNQFYVFNPLGWMRSDVADFPYNGNENIHVKDMDAGIEVPWQIVEKEGQKYLRIFAQDIPSVGYKVFEIIPGGGVPFESNITISENKIENQRYKIEFNSNGAITSLIDKQLSNYEFTRQAYDRYINDLGPGSGTVTVENNGPVSATVRLNGLIPVVHTTRITLFQNSDRIELDNSIDQNFTHVATWNFGFNFDSPTTWHEECGAIIKADLSTNGGHYSPRNARYDWMTMNHFADMSENGRGITISNADCYFMQLGNSTTDYLDSSSPFISVLAGGQVDGKGLGIFGQGGDSYFLQRFALRTHNGYNATRAMKFSLEHQNPLVVGKVQNGSDLPEDKYSFIKTDKDDILLWALKPAEDDPSQIVSRVWNVSDVPQSFAISTPDYTINNVVHTTHLETPIEGIANNDDNFSSFTEKQQLKTFTFNLDRKIASVELLEFGGVYSNKETKLNWRIAQTNDISSIRIQRSRAGQLFKNIGLIEPRVNDTDFSFTDTFISDGPYQYRLKIEYQNGQSSYSNIVEITVTNLTSYRLYQNYPNPFNGFTNISFDVTVLDENSKRERVKLHIFDLKGRKVKTLYDSPVSEGSVDLVWDGTDSTGKEIPSGIYFYQLETAEFSETKRLLLLK